MPITSDQLIRAIQGDPSQNIPPSGGFVTTIAKRLGCTPRNVYLLLKKFKRAQQALDDERTRMKDVAEGKLHELIQEKNPTAIIFYLKTQAKDRGYTERQEHDLSISGDGPIIYLPAVEEGEQ